MEQKYPPLLQKLGRSAAQLAEYHAWKPQVLALYASVADYVRQQTFGYAPTADHTGKLVAPVPHDEVETLALVNRSQNC